MWLPSDKVKGTTPCAAPWAASSLEQVWAGACVGIRGGRALYLGSVPVGVLDSRQSLDWGWGCMEETTVQGLGAPGPRLCLRGLLAARVAKREAEQCKPSLMQTWVLSLSRPCGCPRWGEGLGKGGGEGRLPCSTKWWGVGERGGGWVWAEGMPC